MFFAMRHTLGGIGLMVLLAGSAVAQQSVPSGIRKDPMLAGVLSFIVPGAGQMYAGRVGLGATMLASSVFLVAQIQRCNLREVAGSPCAISPAMLGVSALVVWIWSIASAPDDARRANSR
jgi:hypothetical protein